MELHYSFRGAENATFLDELAPRRRLQLQTYDSQLDVRLTAEEIIAAQRSIPTPFVTNLVTSR